MARFNPLENNFRLYTVINGSHRQIVSAGISLSAGQWHQMTITQIGSRFSGYPDGKLLLQYHDDTILGAGGVGLWTKADAVTLFDAFQVD